MPDSTYTYRQGRKLDLEKQPDELVVRLPPDAAKHELATDAVEKVSSESTRITVAPEGLEAAMSHLRPIAPTHHSYHRADTDDEFLITDRVFVTFAEPPSPEVLDGFLGRWSLVLREAITDRDFLVQLTDHTGMNPVKLVVRLVEDDDLIVDAENDLNHRATKAAPVPIPTDPHYARQWYLHTRSSSPAFDARSSARCEEAWQLLEGFGSPSIVVGVTDDGCRLDHPDLAGKFAGWGYFRGSRLVVDTDVDALPGEMYRHGENHGTSCAGVIASAANGTLGVGAAPGCRLFPIRWELSDGYLLTSDSKLLRVLNHVADRVDVLSNSWARVPTSVWASVVVNRIAELGRTGGRRGKGILFLWAAGNENCPLRHNGTVDVPYSHGWRPQGGSWVWEGPATSRRFENNLIGVPGVAHIAALASTARRSHYSNYGEGIVLCAPSSNVHAYHRMTFPDLAVTTASGAASGFTDTFGGTSSATPLVAGIAALTLSANPDLSAEELLSVLKRTASRDLDSTPYPRTPAADFDRNPAWDVSPVAPSDDPAFRDVGDPDGGWSHWFGFGRVDAAAAVEEALRLAAGDGPVEPPSLELRSSPRLQIPDDDKRRLRDRIHVDEDGVLHDITVQVDIRHERLGDLLINLIPPAGGVITLHRRGGQDRADLQRAYDMQSLVGLRRLRGTEVRGDWTLEVGDRRTGNTGTLESWSLRLDRESNALRSTDPFSVSIPDNDRNGIVRALELPAAPPISEISVRVEVTHSYLPDLVVLLLPPGQPAVQLPLPRLLRGNPLQVEWSSRDLPGLAALRGRNPGGRWGLRVADTMALDEGTLDRWSIEVVS